MTMVVFGIDSEEVDKLYDTLRERQRKTGHVPSRVQCGRGRDGKPVWADLRDRSHAKLERAFHWQLQQKQDKLLRYLRRPSRRLAREVARHMVLCDVLRQLLQ
jgi:hypothetical protein